MQIYLVWNGAAKTEAEALQGSLIDEAWHTVARMLAFVMLL